MKLHLIRAHIQERQITSKNYNTIFIRISPEISPPLGDGIDGSPPQQHPIGNRGRNPRGGCPGTRRCQRIRAKSCQRWRRKARSLGWKLHPPPHRGQFPVGGWFTNPNWKIWVKMGSSSPRIGVKKKYLKPPPRFIVVIRMVGIPTRQQRPFGAISLVLKSWLSL